MLSVIIKIMKPNLLYGNANSFKPVPISTQTFSPQAPSNNSKLLQQNADLKEQVLQLAHQMDELFSRQKQKKKYGLQLHEHQDDPRLQEKLIVLKKQQVRIMQIKNSIFSLKKQNDHTYDHSEIEGKQNIIYALEQELKGLQSQLGGCMNVRKLQEKALSIRKNDEVYTKKVDTLKDQLAKVKEQCKSLQTKVAENERMLKKTHEREMSKQSKLKQIESKLREARDFTKKNDYNVVTLEMISQVEAQIMEFQNQREKNTAAWKDKIGNVNSELHTRRIEEEKKLLVLKEKEKEVRLNDMRLKELRKLLTSQRKLQQASDSLDPSEFRGKRNIKVFEREIP